MNRSTLKRDLKAKQARANRKREPGPVKTGFRKLTVNGVLYQWKVGKKFVEIRTPLASLKYIVPRYRISGFASAAEMREAHDRLDCCHSGCCDACSFGGISPKELRAYIESR